MATLSLTWTPAPRFCCDEQVTGERYTCPKLWPSPCTHIACSVVILSGRPTFSVACRQGFFRIDTGASMQPAWHNSLGISSGILAQNLITKDFSFEKYKKGSRLNRPIRRRVFSRAEGSGSGGSYKTSPPWPPAHCGRASITCSVETGISNVTA